MKKDYHKNDTTIDCLILNTLSMCISGCLAGRFNEASNSRAASEYVIGSVRTYLENYTNDFTVDFFLDNLHQLMRKIYLHTTVEDSYIDDIGPVIRNISTKCSSHIEGDWKLLIKDLFPTITTSDIESIKMLEEIRYIKQEIIRQLNPMLLDELKKGDAPISLEGSDIPLDTNDLPPAIVDLIKSVREERKIPDIDLEIKEIGDKVHISDILCTAYLLDANGKQLCEPGEDPTKALNVNLLGKTAIVIADNLNKVYKCANCDEDHLADVMIYYKHIDTKYFIASKYISILSTTKI